MSNARTFSPLIVELVQVNGKSRGRIHRPLVYRSSEGGKYVVPVDYLTDFASIPRLLWSFLPPMGSYTKAAVIHDHAVEMQRAKGEPRKPVDVLFYNAMRDEGTPRALASLIYYAVRFAAIVRGLG